MDFRNHPFRSVLRALGALLVFSICVLFLGSEAGWTWLPKYLFSLLFALIFAFVSPKWGAISGVIFVGAALYLTPYLEAQVANKGLNFYSLFEFFLYAGGALFLVIGLPAILFFSFRKDRRIREERKARNAAAGKDCCPYCGSTMISYIQPHLDPKFAYDSDGDQYIESMRKVEGYWQCSHCKHTWA